MTNTAPANMIQERQQQHHHESGDAGSALHVEGHGAQGDEKDSHKGGLHWLPFVNRAAFLRAAIVAVVIGSVLTLINQSGWVVGRDPLELLPFILAFVTPFLVVTISQSAAARRAFVDAAGIGAPARPKRFIATTISHGIPARAVAIGLTIGSVNAIIILVGALLRSGNLTVVSIGLLGQVYALPLLFGALSQAISYRRAAHFGPTMTLRPTSAKLVDRAVSGTIIQQPVMLPIRWRFLI